MGKKSTFLFSTRVFQMEDDDTHSHISQVTATGPDNISRDLDILRAQCDRLTETEAIDKSNALGILKLFHNAEVILQKQAHEIDILKMNTQFASTLQDFHGAIRSLKADVDAIKAELEALRGAKRR